MPLSTMNKFAAKNRGAAETGHVPRISVATVNSWLRSTIVILWHLSPQRTRSGPV